ncbi:MAG: DoxX family protein [Thermoanaerobacterales bacterium]|nr:DoxX family protein [Thermoanaerobacterales bacterium]
MGTLRIGLCLLTAAAVGFVAVADLVRARFVLANAAAVGVPERWLVPLGVTKGLGAVGVLAGLAGATTLGALAAGGLVAFFVGAVATHLRARDLALQFPLAYLALSAATLAALATA